MTTACFWSPPETCMEDRFCGEHTNFTTSVWCSTCTVSTAACAREDTSYICHVDLERIIYTGTQRTDDHPHVLISTIKYCCVCFVCVSVCLGISVCRHSCAFVALALTQAIRWWTRNNILCRKGAPWLTCRQQNISGECVQTQNVCVHVESVWQCSQLSLSLSQTGASFTSQQGLVSAASEKKSGSKREELDQICSVSSLYT